MKRLLTIALILAAVGALAAGVYVRQHSSSAAASTSVTTATVERGTLAATLATAGNIEAHQSVDLAFGQSGTVASIHVVVGDRVQAGDILAELDTADLDLQLRSAEVALKNAQNQLAQTENSTTEQDIANARAQLASAEAAYDNLVAGASDAKLASARAQVASAEAAYQAATSAAGTADSSLVSAETTLEKARIALEQAQGAYDKISWRGDVAATSESQALQSATIDYTAAKASYEALLATSATDASSQVASAAAALRSAQASLDELENQVSDADLAAAQATLTQAQNTLDELLAGPDPTDLDIAQNNVESAEIALDQARLQLEQARIEAPFDGVITAVAIEAGQAASGTAISLADLDHLEIVVNMSEVDVNQVAVGQPVAVTLDAIADLALAGTVAEIAPAGVLSSGVVNYPVTIALDQATADVKAGMTASLNIIVAERDDVLTVPNRAVRTANKQKVVTVLVNGQQVQKPVQTGLSNDTLTEIVSGLQEGEVVVLNATTTTTTSGGAGSAPMGVPGVGGPPPGM